MNSNVLGQRQHTLWFWLISNVSIHAATPMNMYQISPYNPFNHQLKHSKHSITLYDINTTEEYNKTNSYTSLSLNSKTLKCFFSDYPTLLFKLAHYFARCSPTYHIQQSPFLLQRLITLTNEQHYDFIPHNLSVCPD